MRLSPAEDTAASPTPAPRSLRPVGRQAGRLEPVIATKLFVPALGARSIDRPRLWSRLDAASRARLGLVVAPAGWGKTTLVAQWLRDTGVACGWLSLDAADDDVTRFWRYLLLAVQSADPGAGSAALRRLDAVGADVERDVLPALVNELADAGRDVVIVLDDYHVVRSRPVHRSVAALLEHMPAPLHVVVTSRTDPPLPLGRLRVAGDMVEIRAEQLGFTAEEAGRMLGHASVPALPAGVVQRLVDRTEGWAAGLQLAALRLADRPDEQSRAAFLDRFTGADRHIVDYVGEEVLDGLPAELREFLLQTSVLTRLCAPLADAVTDRHDAARLLDEIHRAGLFLTPLDDEGCWYRYHQLFRDLLLFELGRTGTARVAGLHRRAAEWLQNHGEPGEAVPHAVASRDQLLAGDLIAGGWRAQFNLGQLQTVQRWLDALPRAQLATDARLTVAQVWLHLDRGRLDEAGAALTAAGHVADTDPNLRVLRTLHAFKAGDVTGAALRLRPVYGPVPDPFLVTVQDLVTGVCALWMGDWGHAADRLRAAAARAEADDNRLAQVYSLGAQGLVAVLTGDLRSAETVLHEADAVMADEFIGAHFVAMFPALARARLSALRGQWADARSSAVRAAELGGRGAGRVELSAALITVAEATRHAEPGRRDAARWLAGAAELLRGCRDPGPTVQNWFTREQRAQRAGRATEAVHAEPLTGRELVVLALLPTHLSQRELAGELFVSQNTMKTHLRAIYRKLGAASRDDAVLRARSLGLV